jgi:anaerobic glycerol-3-phosphate dehydrogenase
LYILGSTKRKKELSGMNLNNGIGEQAINKTIEDHPVIGEILQKYDIGCVTCGVGICLVKDVVSIHALGDQIEAQIEKEINCYLETVHIQEGEFA